MTRSRTTQRRPRRPATRALAALTMASATALTACSPTGLDVGSAPTPSGAPGTSAPGPTSDAVEPGTAPTTGSSTAPSTAPGSSTSAAPVVPVTGGQPARPASEFTDSVCWNTHPWYDWDRVTPLLVDLGVSCVRDGTDIDPAHYRSLYQDHGIRVILITDHRKMDGAAVRDYVKAVGPEAVIAVENNNEPRGFIGGDWAPDVRAHQIDLWTSIKGDPATAGVRVATSSPLSGDDVTAVGDVSEYADWGNVHNYYGGHHPESTGWGDDGYGSWDWSRRTLVEPAVGDEPFIATETCYHNALDTPSGHSPASERASGTYIPRVYLSHFAHGMPHTACYEFWSQGTNPAEHEENFGVVRNDYSPKPAYTAMRNLLGELSDSGAPFTPGGLDYTLSGRTEDVQDVLLQKSDGTLYLALWQGVESWRVAEEVDVDVPDVPVTVTLGSAADQLALCRPEQSADCAALPAGSTVDVDVPDDVVLLRVG